MSEALELRGLVKSFGDLTVLADVSMTVESGETIALLGPSGSGKTTLLRTIAGFETADRGTLHVGGVDITSLPPAKRRFGMVFQHYALFPHLSVGENVAFGLDGGDSAERSERVAEVLELVDLAGFEARRIHQISGGQQQRVALARALAPRPRVLLLDEPLSNLDRTLREKTRREIRETLGSLGMTAVWVTHEQEEAFDVGDRVAVLNRGNLEQFGPPEELYRQPATRFVAGFVGRASSIRGVWRGDGRVTVSEEPALVWDAECSEPLEAGRAVELVFRPEALDLDASRADGLAVTVRSRRYAGSQTFYSVESDRGDRFDVISEAGAASPGDAARVLPRPGAGRPRAFAL